MPNLTRSSAAGADFPAAIQNAIDAAAFSQTLPRLDAGLTTQLNDGLVYVIGHVNQITGLQAVQIEVGKLDDLEYRARRLGEDNFAARAAMIPGIVSSLQTLWGERRGAGGELIDLHDLVSKRPAALNAMLTRQIRAEQEKLRHRLSPQRYYGAQPIYAAAQP